MSDIGPALWCRGGVTSPESDLMLERCEVIVSSVCINASLGLSHKECYISRNVFLFHNKCYHGSFQFIRVYTNRIPSF